MKKTSSIFIVTKLAKHPQESNSVKMKLVMIKNHSNVRKTSEMSQELKKEEIKWATFSFLRLASVVLWLIEAATDRSRSRDKKIPDPKSNRKKSKYGLRQ